MILLTAMLFAIITFFISLSLHRSRSPVIRFTVSIIYSIGIFILIVGVIFSYGFRDGVMLSSEEHASEGVAAIHKWLMIAFPSILISATLFLIAFFTENLTGCAGTFLGSPASRLAKSRSGDRRSF